eukprot:jgi/Mesvir1/23226/Mv21742-RA.1
MSSRWEPEHVKETAPGFNSMRKVPRSNGEKRDVFSIARCISDRFVMLKARLVLLLVISAVIIITAAVIWSISLKATNDSFDGMSAQLRGDVTAGAVKEIKNLLSTLSLAANILYLALEGVMPNFDLETMRGPVLPVLWSIFNSYKDITATNVISSQDFVSGYRRNGPERQLLNSSVAVAIPPPADNTVDLVHGYVPDPITGGPNFSGPHARICLVGRCPKPLNYSLYLGPGVNPVRSPPYLSARNLPRQTFYWSIAVENGFQPYLFVAGPIKDKVTGNTSAVLSMTAIATKLQTIVQETSIVQRFDGRMYITVGRHLNMVTSSHGVLFVPPAEPGATPGFIQATNASDPIISKSSTYMNNTYGERLFTDPFQVITTLPGHGSFYIHTEHLWHENLLLNVFVVVPRHEFRGEIDISRRQGVLIAMGMAFALFIVGGLAMCLSTTMLSRALKSQERKLDTAAAANKELSNQLATLTSRDAMAWPEVDMGTPLEKLTRIIQGMNLKGHVLSGAQVMQMQKLIAADDLHKPQFLAAIQAGVEGDPEGSLHSSNMDSETGSWIEIFATGRRGAADFRRVSNEIVPKRHRSDPLFRWANNRSSRAFDPLDDEWVAEGDDNEMLRRSVSLTQAMVGLELDEGIPKEQNKQKSQGASKEVARCAAEIMPVTKAAGLRRSTEHTVFTLRSLSDKNPHDPIRNNLVRLHRVPAGKLDEQSLETLRHVTLMAATAPWGNAPSRISGEEAVLCHPVGVALQGAREPAKLLPTPHGNGLHGLALNEATASEQHQKQVALLRKIGDWDFDTLALARVVSPDSVVQLVGFTLFTKTGLLQEFNINETKLGNFLQQIGRGMQPHPYHNSIHISDVSASLFHLLSESGVGDHLQSIDRLAAVCAALVHDYKHPGVNNDFINRTNNDLATIYNDNSPLENYHLTEAFHLLYSNEHCNFLGELSDADFHEVRRIVIDLVLASDLKRHFGILDQFKARVSQSTPWDIAKESDRTLLMQLALKVSDIGHAAKPLAVHQEWSRRVTEEFYKQGDAEREAKLDVSPFMDRFNNSMPRSQVGFFQFLAMPLFEAWVKAFPRSAHLLSNTTANIAYWKQELHATGQ